MSARATIGYCLAAALLIMLLIHFWQPIKFYTLLAVPVAAGPAAADVFGTVSVSGTTTFSPGHFLEGLGEAYH